MRYADWKDSEGGIYNTDAMIEDNAARKLGVETYAVVSATPGWSRSGSCEWMIDGAGKLTVRPLGGGVSGVLADWGSDSAPWCYQWYSIKSVSIEQGVVARTCCGMFRWCSSLEALDLSGLDVSKIVDMSYMFSGCSSLKTIWVARGFNALPVKSSYGMFSDCGSLVGGAGTAYDSSSTDATRARIDGGEKAPGYFTGKHEKLDGDVNGNGILNVVDAQIVYDIATTDFYKDRQDYADMRARADVTWDDEVDASDAFAIQYAALRGW